MPPADPGAAAGPGEKTPRGVQRRRRYGAAMRRHRLQARRPGGIRRIPVPASSRTSNVAGQKTSAAGSLPERQPDIPENSLTMRRAHRLLDEPYAYEEPAHNRHVTKQR